MNNLQPHQPYRYEWRKGFNDSGPVLQVTGRFPDQRMFAMNGRAGLLAFEEQYHAARAPAVPLPDAPSTAMFSAVSTSAPNIMHRLGRAVNNAAEHLGLQ